MSLFNNVSAATMQAIKEQAPRLLSDAGERYLPPHLRAPLEEIVSLYESGFALDEVKQAGVRALVNNGQSRAVREIYLNSKNPLLGGVTPLAAIDYMSSSPRRAQANLFLVAVSPIDSKAANHSEAFNMMVRSLDYSPFTISGDYHRVGGALVDGITGNEAVELNMTTMDDESGTLKRWFAQMLARVSASDGTVGVPASYGIKIEVTHAFGGGDIPEAAYKDKGLFRAGNLSMSLSRGENALEDLQMTFNQLDTFWG